MGRWVGEGGWAVWYDMVDGPPAVALGKVQPNWLIEEGGAQTRCLRSLFVTQ